MKILKVLLFLFVILVFVISKYTYLDYQNKCLIFTKPFILPSNINTNKVLKFLKDTDTDEYKKICENVSIIDKYPACGGLDGGCYYLDKDNTIHIGNDQGDISLAAAIIIHENCHLLQHIEGRELGETECYDKMNKYLLKITNY